MKKVSIFEGKNKFSEIVNGAANGEPQIITKNGRETAVIISFDDYKRLSSRKESLSEFLLKSPFHGSGIDLTRDKDLGRPVLDFSDEVE